MRKNILVIVFCSLLGANEFETNCINCHQNQTQLKMIMGKYTLKFSSQKRVETAMFEFLKNPSKEKSAMPFGFISRFGVKDKSTLEDEVLKKSIHQYYEKYNLTQYIK